MKIAFSFINCGLGDNGGTRTIVKSAEALAMLGQQVEIWTNLPNRLTWFPIPESVRLVRSNRLDKFGGADVVIAGGCRSVMATLDVPDCQRRMYWIRALEDWMMPQEQLIDGFQSGLELLANAEWLQEWVKTHAKRDVEILRPGIELDFFTPDDRPDHGDVVTIGVLYSVKRRKRFKEARDVLKRVKSRFGARVRLHAFGNEKLKDPLFDRFLLRPSEEEKRELYRDTDIWFGPSASEGLHVVPLEAGACGCAVVTHGKPSGGMLDYSQDRKTALVFKSDNFTDAELALSKLVKDGEMREELRLGMRHLIETKIGDRQTNMCRFLFRHFQDRVREEAKARFDAGTGTDGDAVLLNFNMVETTLAEGEKWPALQLSAFTKELERHGHGKDAKLLDVGCRCGAFLSVLKGDGWSNILGMDFVPAFVRTARGRGLNVVCGDANAMQFANGEFDVVHSRHLLEHVVEPLRVVGEQLRVLAPGGVIINQYPVGQPSVKHLSLGGSDLVFREGVAALAETSGCQLEFYGPSQDRDFKPQGKERIMVIHKPASI